MVDTIFKSKITYFVIALYVIIVVWWLKLNLLPPSSPTEAYIFNWSYGLINLSGGLYAIFGVSKIWGGYKSIIGKGLILIGLGLLGQWFGLQIWTYYNLILKLEVPYPSLADLGYFSLIPFYTIGAWMFSQACGGKLSLRTTQGKLYAVIIPISMLSIAYFLFAKDIGIDLTNPLRAFLDYGYPFGEVLPVSIAIFTLFASRNFMGGKMTEKIFFLIFAFAFQFLTEYFFLFSAGNGSYKNGGLNDIMYATSYFIMFLGLISFRKYD